MITTDKYHAHTLCLHVQVDKDLRVMLVKPDAPPPKTVDVTVWPRAIPQFNLHHLDQVQVGSCMPSLLTKPCLLYALTVATHCGKTFNACMALVSSVHCLLGWEELTQEWVWCGGGGGVVCRIWRA